MSPRALAKPNAPFSSTVENKEEEKAMKKSHFHTPSRKKQSAGTGQLTALKDLERFTPDNTAHHDQPPEALKTTTNSGLFCHFIIDRFLSSIEAIPEKPGEGFAPPSKVRKAVWKAPPLFVFPFAQGLSTILSSRFQMSTGQELEQSGPQGPRFGDGTPSKVPPRESRVSLSSSAGL